MLHMCISMNGSFCRDMSSAITFYVNVDLLVLSGHSPAPKRLLRNLESDELERAGADFMHASLLQEADEGCIFPEFNLESSFTLARP